MTDLRLKCTKFDLAGAPPQTPLGELTALPQTPWLDLGAASRQGRGWAGEEEGKGREREGGGSGGEGKGGPQVTVEPGPLRALLRHWP